MEKIGDKRIKRRFLLFPLCINGETRWLEIATWQEEYNRMIDSLHPSGYPTFRYEWVAKKWIGIFD
jgi:hypothetical protein